jgi:hypothetical protein
VNTPVPRTWEGLQHLASAKFEVVQDGNTCGTTSETESMEIFLETQLPGDEPFFVIQTGGWSVDNPGEMFAMLSAAQDSWEQMQAHMRKDRYAGKGGGSC